MASTTHSRVFCCRCCHCCCCSYVASPVHMFFATTIFRYLSTTIHDDPSDALPHLSRGPSEQKKKTMFRISGLNKHQWSESQSSKMAPMSITRLENILKRKAQLDPTCMLSQLYRLLDFYGAAPHSWKEPVKPFLKIKPFLGVAGVELDATNNWVLTYDLNIYPEFVVLSYSL